MLRPRTPGPATVALLIGLYLAMLGLCLLLLAALPRLPLEPVDSRRLAQARPALLALGLASLLAGAWLVPGAWLAVRQAGAPRPRFVSWRYGLRTGAAFAATWFVVDVVIGRGGPVHALLVGAVFLAAFPLLAGAVELLWPRGR